MMYRIFSTVGVLLAMVASHAAQPPALTSDGYKVPVPGAPLSFPKDHASHPGYRIEWWYLTGHLFTSEGRRFGYQATFFRSALEPLPDQSPAPFGNSQLYLTHMALSDPETGRFLPAQRLSRDGWDAYARTDRLDVRNGSWWLRGLDDDVSAMQLHGSAGTDAAWSLQMEPVKPLVRFGEDGTSRKGPNPENRSYYLTFTRLRTQGTVTIDGTELEVTGSSWMDHEFASSQLEPGYTGWDWIAIQLDDGWEVKAYLLRDANDAPSPFSALIWINPEGVAEYRGPDAFRWEKPTSWQSPATNAIYPHSPVIHTRHPVSGKDVTFTFEPLMDDQELAFPGTTYWEGAGRIRDGSGTLIGSAYLELVGYAGPIAGLR